ncbi:MAG: LamG-like jellyroll fold domain-containing protein [Thermoguttaceae bacterium]
MNDGKWHLVVAERRRRVGSIYVDGVLSASASGAVRPLAKATGVFVGADPRVNNMYFNGDIDDVRIYRTALNAGSL